MIASVGNLKQINDEIGKITARRILYGKRIIIFGCTIYARDIKTALEKNNFHISAMIDNNSKKCGKMCLGVMVYHPRQYLEKYQPDAAVIICSNYYHEMAEQLKQWGYRENREFFVIPAEKGGQEENDSRGSFREAGKKIYQGKRFYKKLMSSYSRECWLFLCPYPGTGDVYLACSFLRAYLEKCEITDFVMGVLGNRCFQIAKLFKMEKVKSLEPEEMELLLNLFQFYDTGSIRIKPLLYWNWRVKKFLYADHYPQITFTDMFRYDVYGLDEWENPVKPGFKPDSSYPQQLFREKGLQPGKTVILAPYASSFLSGITADIWESMAERLKSRGYSVCTNSSGEREPVIAGTKQIFFPYEEAVNVLEYAGGFIALRSGFCDVVSSARCKMVILYENGFNAVRYEYFSLLKMGLSEHTIELIFEDNHNNRFVNTVIDSITWEKKSERETIVRSP